MPLDPRIPLMGNIYQPDFGEIAQNRAQSMNVLSQMRQRDQELAQQNALAEYMKGDGFKNNPLGALQFGEAGRQGLSAFTSYQQAQTAQDKAAREATEAKRAQQEKIFGTSLMRAYSDPSDANLDERFADMEVAGIDTSAFRQMIGEVPDPAARKKYLDDFLNTTEEGRVFMDRFVSKPREIKLNNRVLYVEGNENRDDYNQEISRYDMGVSPDQASRERVAGEDRASREKIAQQQQAAKPSLSATEQKNKIELESNLSRADGALNALNTILAENLIQQSPAGLLETTGSIAQRSVNAASNQNAALARLGVLADKILKNVERFEGPQGVYDVKSYEKAAGDMANPLKSDSERLAAAQTLIGLMEQAKETTLKRLAQYQDAGAGAGGGGVTYYSDLKKE